MGKRARLERVTGPDVLNIKIHNSLTHITIDSEGFIDSSKYRPTIRVVQTCLNSTLFKQGGRMVSNTNR